MRAMILAAGRGTRMGALTNDTPKPLLKVGGRFLIEYSILALKKAGIQDIVINISYHAEKIKQALGTGKQYGVTIHYSEEPEVLETGGGIFQALPLLGDGPFIVVSSDIVTDFPLQNLAKNLKKLAHLVLVDNPVFHPRGDFSLAGENICYSDTSTFTFSNVGIYQPELFADCQPGKFRLADVFKRAIQKNQITGEHYRGVWHNVGTPQDILQFETENSR